MAYTKKSECSDKYFQKSLNCKFTNIDWDHSQKSDLGLSEWNTVFSVSFTWDVWTLCHSKTRANPSKDQDSQEGNTVTLRLSVPHTIFLKKL